MKDPAGKCSWIMMVAILHDPVKHHQGPERSHQNLRISSEQQQPDGQSDTKIWPRYCGQPKSCNLRALAALVEAGIQAPKSTCDNARLASWKGETETW